MAKHTIASYCSLQYALNKLYCTILAAAFAMAVIFIPKKEVHMAKAKYTQSKDGKWYAYVWDGTYTATGAKKRKKLSSSKSSGGR